MITHPVAALAGRRIDAEGANERRFPLERTDAVRAALGRLLDEAKVETLVCSAACGADLLALEEAGNRGVRRRVVLPFDRGRFRESSVVDRPGPWGPMFDKVIAEVMAAGDLVTLDDVPSDAAYEAATQKIIAEALELASNQSPIQLGQPLAIIIWEEASRGPGDITESFRRQAVEKGFIPLVIRTI